MQTQVFVIHGGNTFDSYEEYFHYLQAKEVTLESLQYKDWKHDLSETLGEAYEVIAPRMPNGNNAKYVEWKIYFEKFIPFLRDGVIFVGHSLGGIFLAKYLSEEFFPKKICAAFLVAAPFSAAAQHSLGDFILSSDLRKFLQQGGQIFLYHSKDDEVVPFSNFEQYVSLLPDAKNRVFDDRNHLNQEDFPELLIDIKTLN
ncbi:MAG: alpha/beta hydrolase [Minisyncoccia bacterium]